MKNAGSYRSHRVQLTIHSIGVAERFLRTLKEQVVHIASIAVGERLPQAPHRS